MMQVPNSVLPLDNLSRKKCAFSTAFGFPDREQWGFDSQQLGDRPAIIHQVSGPAVQIRQRRGIGINP